MIERLQHSIQFLAEHWIGFLIAFAIWLIGIGFILWHTGIPVDDDDGGGDYSNHGGE